MATGNSNVGSVTLEEIGTPSTPAANNNIMYTKSGGGVYVLDDTGAERQVGLQNATVSRVKVERGDAASGSGFGTTDTSIRSFVDPPIVNTGSAISYAAPTGGAGTEFIINEDGIYSITYSDIKSGAGTPEWGISVNSNQRTTSISAITNTHRYAEVTHQITGVIGMGMTWVGKLSSGDEVRAHTSGTGAFLNGDRATAFDIQQLMKL
jgi:hypothetical protein